MTLKAIVLFGLLSSSAVAVADRVWVEPVKGGGIPEAERESIEELVRIGVPQAGAHTVAAKKEDADVILSPSLMKLGDSYILSIQKKNAAGQTQSAEKMKANSLDEMDTIAVRVTRAVLNGTSAGGTQDITNVTREEETHATRRTNATRQWVVGFGPGWTQSLGSAGGGFTFMGGFLWGVDPDFSINLTLNTNSGRKSDDSSYTDFTLGGEYYFLRSRNSPFIGGRIGWGTARVDDDKCNALSIGCEQDRASGWAGTVTAGYKLFRTSDVNMAIMGSYSHIFDKTTLGDPSLTSVQIAVYF